MGKEEKEKISKERAIIALATNLLVILGIPLSFIIIGIPMLVIAWIWSIVTGVQLLDEAGI